MSPFDHDRRHSITPLRFAKIFARADGRCQGPCKRKLGPGDRYDVDHIIALERGGTDDDDNLQILCEGCHALKTRDDHGESAHIKRSYANHVVPKAYRRSRSWGRR